LPIQNLLAFRDYREQSAVFWDKQNDVPSGSERKISSASKNGGQRYARSWRIGPRSAARRIRRIEGEAVVKCHGDFDAYDLVVENNFGATLRPRC
jgi:hypothetical protein